MRALDPEVADTVFEAVVGLIPDRVDDHPLGCHRLRVPDRVCFEGILIRLAVGCSWEDTERLMNHQVSDTTLRARRDEWIDAGVFDALVDEAVTAYDKIIGLDLSDVAVDGSQHKAPCGGVGTGANSTDRRKLGWKWSICTDRAGIPIGWAIDGANRHDVILFEPTLADVEYRGYLAGIDTLHLDRGYDAKRVRSFCDTVGIGELDCPRRRKPGTPKPDKPDPLGLRWTVERTNSWLTNFGQLRRNTDRKPRHRGSQLALAITIIITAKLIDWRNRWNLNQTPIR